MSGHTTVEVKFTIIEERKVTLSVPDGASAEITDAVDQQLFADPHVGEATKAQEIAFSWSEVGSTRFGGRTY